MNDGKITVLITGASGMIGSETVNGLLNAGFTVYGVDFRDGTVVSDGYSHYKVDLSDRKALLDIIENNRIDRIIHLAALAHTVNGKKYSWDDYYHLNVECARNVFETAGDRPVLQISTVDVFGFYDGKNTVNGDT